VSLLISRCKDTKILTTSKEIVGKYLYYTKGMRFLDSFLQARLAKFTISADGDFVQVPLAQITWYHHISMFPKVKDMALRAFYMTETAIHG